MCAKGILYNEARQIFFEKRMAFNVLPACFWLREVVDSRAFICFHLQMQVVEVGGLKPKVLVFKPINNLGEVDVEAGPSWDDR